jgi:metallo-beta-lactamase class B
LGALISLYGALEYQNVFSKALIFSPAFWFSNQCFAHATAQGKQQDMRIYMLCGQNEGSNMATYQTQMRTTLLNAGFGANEVVNIPKADGQHSEWFWKREFGAGYQWLFSNTVGNEAAIQPEEINVFADPFTDSATILLPTNTHKARLILTDMQGRVWIKRNIRSEELLQLSHLPAGIYNISIATKTQTLTQKVVKK